MAPTENAPARHTNRLIRETSPYLLQHAYNPVDWYSWGPEAFARAHAEQKPVLLSVGYSACHWCHVMERESFENEAIASLMNQLFVCVKVDREERPDVDSIYMTAVQLLTGQGGWPMTVFLTPEGKPFYGGTYFPPDDAYGRPGFPRILQAVAAAWADRREEVEAQSVQLMERLDQGIELARGHAEALLTPELLEASHQNLTRQFDPQYGGFGNAPKFPHPANLDFLLRIHARTHNPQPLENVEITLRRMACGGIYDQIGGGFHRYSTDRIWLAPHFEKMLYDNAQLAQTYARGYQATGNAFYKRVAEETLEYILREMTDAEGGFFSAQDADSEGEEGKFFVWTPQQIREVLGERDGEIFCALFDVTSRGNWEGKNILRSGLDLPEAAERFGQSVQEMTTRREAWRVTLREARSRRVKPGLDDKVLTAWNGLALAAFAECAAVFDRDDFRQAAVKNAEFVLSRLTQTADAGPPWRLYRTWRRGEARLNGYLEDYAFYAEGLIRLYEATFDERWLLKAKNLADTMIVYFWDEAEGGFFATSSDHETLIQRPKSWDDNATPGGNSVAVEVLLRLAAYFDQADYRERADRVLRQVGPLLPKHPQGFARMLGALDFLLAGPLEIGLRGTLEDEVTQAMRRSAFTPYLPNKIVGFLPRDAQPAGLSIAFLNDRPAIQGQTTAYVCENSTCHLPITDAAALAERLSSHRHE